jgi:hypothetical protein
VYSSLSEEKRKGRKGRKDKRKHQWIVKLNHTKFRKLHLGAPSNQ